MLLVIGAICLLVGIALALVGMTLAMIFDIDFGETLLRIGITMIILPVVTALLVGAFLLLLSLFGLALLF